MAPSYRVEHVATVPAGYRVRTVTRNAHRIRIAYPPGSRRVEGSGRVVEVLHPQREANPCRLPNPAELVVMLANPSGEGQSASNLYEQFHGEPAKHVDTYDEPSPRPATLTELGDLVEIRVKRVNGWKWAEFDFSGRGIKVACNANGTQIYFVGGDQKISRGELTRIGVDNRKEMIDLGEARYIAYRAKKQQVNGIASTYEHGLGEVSGVGPRLLYDRRGPQPRLYFTGGEYHVEGVGIVN